MSEKLRISYSMFREHFGYRANYPNEIDFDQNEYAKLLDKCVEENFDYTVELYGTNPKIGSKPNDGIYID